MEIMPSTELFLLPTVDLQSKYTTLHSVQFLRFSVRFTPSKYQPLILYTSKQLYTFTLLQILVSGSTLSCPLGLQQIFYPTEIYAANTYVLSLTLSRSAIGGAILLAFVCDSYFEFILSERVAFSVCEN